MQPWWWRSVAACASVLVLAGLVAVLAGAVGADRAVDRAAAVRATDAEAVAAPAERPSPAAATASGEAPAPVPAPAPPDEPEPGPGRVPDAATATTVAVLPGWRAVPTQDVIEIPAGRFEDATILQRGANAVVLVGLADPARVPPLPEPRPSAALDAEARRLADAYVEQLAPGTDAAALTDNGEEIADLPTRTSVRRVEGGALDGALVRVSTIAAPGRTLAVLAVARPSPTVGADGDAADAVVRSLRLDPA